MKIPAYEALRQNHGLSQYMLGGLLRGISTRDYKEVLPRMAATVGVSKSAVSREAIEASAEQLEPLQQRRWDKVEILVIIENPHSGVRPRTHNVSRWRDADMVQRWVASAWLLTETFPPHRWSR